MAVIDITVDTRKSTEQIRLGAYCRVSSNSEDQLHSFAAQIRHYKDYERSHPEYKLIDIYADEGLTGTTTENRSELHRLIRDCQDGKIDRVIIKSVSRLARNTCDLLVAIRMFKELGVSVYFEEQDIDTDLMNMEMIVTFPGMLAQQESESISGNMRWSYKKRMESGEFNCSYPAYGFRMTDNRLEIYEPEAEIIRRIFDLYLQGLGMHRIANILNDEKIPNRFKDSKWHRTTIAYILNNERYMGDSLLQKNYTTETLPFKKKKNKGELPQFYVEGSNPAIISKETFLSAHELLQSRAPHAQKPRESYLLSGIIRCSECGRSYRRHISRGVTYWACSSREAGASNCGSLRLREIDVYDAFISMISKLTEHRDYLLGTLIYQIESMNKLINNNHDKIRQIDEEIAIIASKNLVIARLHSNGILNASEYASQSSDLTYKLTELRSKRLRIISDNGSDKQLEDLKSLYQMLENNKPYSGLDNELFRSTVHSIIANSTPVLIFKLIGDLKLPEEIPLKGRCICR